MPLSVKNIKSFITLNVECKAFVFCTKIKISAILFFKFQKNIGGDYFTRINFPTFLVISLLTSHYYIKMDFNLIKMDLSGGGAGGRGEGGGFTVKGREY
jgi:hypothetical protein